jgi:D-serine deaminase-like pyridoxal phosphate-dependent protein
MTAVPWYEINDVESLDTPSIAIYIGRVKKNIQTFVESIDDVNRLRPHIKTHKSPEISVMMQEAGINKFKCATIAEAEMLASIEANDVLLAYQPVGPKAKRLLTLVKKFAATKFSCLIDNAGTAAHLSEIFVAEHTVLPVFIDLNVGMNRTGIIPEEAYELYTHCKKLKGIEVVGLHAYDGHIRDKEFGIRKRRCDESFSKVETLRQQIKTLENRDLTIIAGGTPTYSVHSKRKNIECSPGTFVYWDKTYEEILIEQHYLPAALVITRVISKPSSNVVCIDLGHKSIASENALDKRVFFLNAKNMRPIGHSEEHMVFAVDDEAQFEVGDVLYGVPYHICPTIALHEKVSIVENNRLAKYWETLARNRKITI